MVIIMKITILCAGKIKEKFFSMAVSEYTKRLTRYCKLEIVEVADEKTPEHISERQEEQIKDREAQRMIKYIHENAYVCALAIEGRQMDSVAFSNMLEKLSIGGKSHIIFVIGGSLGLGREILNRADMLLSFSKMTFPHQFMRVILLEQIYRGYRIMKGEPYHK